MKPREIAAKFLLLCAGCAVGLAGVEGLLAAAGVERTWRGYAENWAQDDLAARFIPRPGNYPGEFDADTRFNSLGLRGPEIRRADVLFLGDSCTFGVGVKESLTFPSLIGARGLAAANAGVPGYNTALGLARLEESPLLTLKPRAVVLYFGWNDFRGGAATERTFARLRRLSEKTRIAALLLRAQQSLWTDQNPWVRMRFTRQVPLADYKANLLRMIALCRAAGAKVFVVTDAHDPGHFHQGWFLWRDFRRFHQSYLEASRDAAREGGAVLVDFAADVETAPADERKTLFLDPIHPSAAGHRRLAGLLWPAFVAAGITPAGT